MRINLNRLRPRLAVVGRAGKHHLRIGQSPARPANVEIAGVATLAIVRYDVRLILKRDSWRTGLLGYGSMHGLPGLSPIKRAAHKNSVAGRSVSPVIETTQLVECDVTDESVTMIIERHRNIARDAVVLGVHVSGRLPGMTRICRIGGVHIVLKNSDNLLWVCRIHRNRRL